MKYISTKTAHHQTGLLLLSTRICCLVIAFIALMLFAPQQAIAQTTVYLNNTSNVIAYGGWGTDEMYINNLPAYCAEPHQSAPISGTYQTAPISPKKGDAGTSHEARFVAATLWFGYGGPGFDPSIWPSTWHDGNPMTKETYWAATHLVVADFYLSNADFTLSGCDGNFRKWAKGNLLSYVDANQPNHPNAAQTKIANRIQEVPQSFIDACYQISPHDKQVIICFERGGWLDLEKVSTLEEMSANNPLYSLQGAVYGLYRSESDAQQDLYRLETLITDEVGYAKSSYLAEGTYYLREITPSEGFARDETIYQAQVRHATTTRINNNPLPEVPQHYLDLVLGKYDANKTYQPSGNQAQGNAELAGAEFLVEYYQGLYNSVEQARNEAKPYRSWTFKTNELGLVSLSDASDLFISGDELFYNADGKVAFPLGSYVVTEVKAPKGYLLSSKPSLLHITSAGNLPVVNHIKPTTQANDVIRGGVSLIKLDAESGLSSTLGGASLAATFEITNTSQHSVYVNGVWYEPNDVVFTGQSKRLEDGSYVFTTDTNQDGTDTTLPYGSYSIKEVLPGTGYLLDVKTVEFSISNDKEVVSISSDSTFSNQVKRGDLEFIKAREDTSQRLAHIPFRITSNTTGEWHLAVTDENGYFSTASDWNPHTNNTNANDTASEETYQSDAGIWFGLTAENTITRPQDSLGALPYDTYTIEELPCPRNEGLTLLTLKSISISRNKTVVDLGTFDNIAPSIHTVARDAIDKDKLVYKHESTIINDHVSYTGLEAGKTYLLEAWAIDKQSLTEIVDSRVALTFTPKTSSGTVEIRLPVNTLGLSGNEIVVYEELYLNERLITEHKNPEDTEQTVLVLSPHIDSSAINPSTDDKTIYLDTQAAVVDEVTYRNLIPGEAYTLTGSLMVKHVNERGEVSVEPLTKDEAPVEKEITFTPEQSDGSISLEFTFDSTGLANKELVIYQTLSKAGVEVAKHADSESVSQTVKVVPLGIDSFAVDESDSDKTIIGQSDNAVVDKLQLSNLSSGKSYTINGRIMERYENEDGSIDAKPFIVNGQAVETQQEFTPERQQEGVEVRFTFDGQGIDTAKNLVVYEEVYLDDVLVASHVNPQDEDQSLVIANDYPEPETPEPLTPLGVYDQTGQIALFGTLGASLLVAALALLWRSYHHFSQSRRIIERIRHRIRKQ